MKLNFSEKTILDLTTPAVMGILNLTANSFYAKTRTTDPSKALAIALQMQDEGADIIDIGAEATNPQIDPITAAQEELKYLLPVLEKIVPHLNIPISVDTSKPEVMQVVVAAGASLINDVRGLRWPGAVEMAAKLNVPICIMHMAQPFAKQAREQKTQPYQTIVPSLIDFFQQRIQTCLQQGIAKQQLIIDPGFGGGCFGKSTQENLYLLSQLSRFSCFDLPILVGLSRKTFIGEICEAQVDTRLAGSLAALKIACDNGANILRVHDVKATRDYLKFHQKVMEV
ncbi:MAG: dihydropteroate synthase [Pseudomonadota bacterium]